MSEREAFEAWIMRSESADEISLERLRHGSRVFDEYANKEIEAMWIAWKARAAFMKPSEDCPYCNGTGEADSGGIHPWGTPATIPCRCLYEDPFHVPVAKYEAVKAAMEQAQEELRAAVQASVPDCTVVDRGFRWDGDKQQHIPQLIVEFEPVPFDGPNNAKGWVDRDALAKSLSAIPKG